MNRIIKQQLEKCRIAPLPKWDENTTHMVIPKLAAKNNKSFIPGSYYVIRLEDYLVHPPQDDVLHKNWNNGIVPKCDCFLCEVVQSLNKMVKIEGVGYDLDKEEELNYTWGGWLPLEGIEVIRELDT